MSTISSFNRYVQGPGNSVGVNIAARSPNHRMLTGSESTQAEPSLREPLTHLVVDEVTINVSSLFMVISAIRLLKKAVRKASSAIAMLAFLAMFTSAFAGDTDRQGSFKGLNNHITSGTATLVKVDGGYIIELGKDFMFDGAPDPKVAFGKDGQFDAATLIEALRANSGAQSYAVPTTINPEDFNEIYIWCEQYSVGLGVASIN